MTRITFYTKINILWAEARDEQKVDTASVFKSCAVKSRMENRQCITNRIKLLILFTLFTLLHHFFFKEKISGEINVALGPYLGFLALVFELLFGTKHGEPQRCADVNKMGLPFFLVGVRVLS